MSDVSIPPPLREPNLDIDTIEEMLLEAEVLRQARRILLARWEHSHRYDAPAGKVHVAMQDLLSRSRHPSRQPRGPRPV